MISCFGVNAAAFALAFMVDPAKIRKPDAGFALMAVINWIGTVYEAVE